jgi:hypothetical protein
VTDANGLAAVSTPVLPGDYTAQAVYRGERASASGVLAITLPKDRMTVSITVPSGNGDVIAIA